MTLKQAACCLTVILNSSNPCRLILSLWISAIFNDLEWPLAHVSRASHHSMLNDSETVQDKHMLTTHTNGKWYVARPTALCPFPVTLINFQDHFSYFCLNIGVSLLFRSLIESPGNPTKDDIADNLVWPLKPWRSLQVLQTVSLSVCQKYTIRLARLITTVEHSYLHTMGQEAVRLPSVEAAIGQTLYVSNYFDRKTVM